MLRPKIFIGSRLSLARVREELKRLLECSGFEVDIYEKDLTPASAPATYLTDIKDADLVLFVFDERYGTLRENTRLSGTHEEWNIATDLGIPRHVYLRSLRRNRGRDRRQVGFIDRELKGREISYCHFSSNRELVSQVQKSITRMVLDIAYSGRFCSRIQRERVEAILAAHELRKFVQLKEIKSQLFEIDNRALAHYVSDVWAKFTDSHYCAVEPFLDGKLVELYMRFLKEVRALASKDANSSSPGPHGVLPGPAMILPDEKVKTSFFIFQGPGHGNYRAMRTQALRRIRGSWQRLEEAVHQRFETTLG